MTDTARETPRDAARATAAASPAANPAASPAANPAGGAARRGRPGYDRATLLRECVEVFNRHGYEGTSMGMLAQHLGISKSAIYHHVESKEAILGQALDDALDALEASLDAVRASGAAPGEQVDAAVRGTLRVLAEKMPQVTLLLRVRGNSEVERAAMERRRAVTRRLGEMLAAAQAEGSVRDDVSAPTLARLALGMINSIVDWYKLDPAGPSRTGVEEMAAAVAGVVLGGLRG